MSIHSTFGTDDLDSVFKQYAPVLYSMVYYADKHATSIDAHISDYAELNQIKGRLAELQKRCDEQALIIRNLTQRDKVVAEDNKENVLNR